jgi:ABC-2 type transport system permease protein
MGRGADLDLTHPITFIVIALLVAAVAASVGLTLGCSVGQTQIGLMFSLVLAPMIFFGCTYYPWSALASFPILSRVVLINPVVYASEGFRSTLLPQFPHLPVWGIFVGLSVSVAFFLLLGIRQFRKKAII